MADVRSVSRGEAIDRAVVPGVLAGIVAAAVMGLFAAIAAATWRHLTVTAPLREIAALVTPDAVAKQAADVVREPLIFAGAIHLGVGGFFGAVFGVVARAARPRGRVAVLAGALYGLGVMALMSLVVLPVVAGLSGAGAPISGLPGRVGWATFAAAHVLFGLVLGLWVLVRPSDVAAEGGDGPEITSTGGFTNTQ
jgi:hypothetical protein